MSLVSSPDTTPRQPAALPVTVSPYEPLRNILIRLTRVNFYFWCRSSLAADVPPRCCTPAGTARTCNPARVAGVVFWFSAPIPASLEALRHPRDPSRPTPRVPRARTAAAMSPSYPTPESIRATSTRALSAFARRRSDRSRSAGSNVANFFSEGVLSAIFWFTNARSSPSLRCAHQAAITSPQGTAAATSPAAIQRHVMEINISRYAFLSMPHRRLESESNRLRFDHGLSTFFRDLSPDQILEPTTSWRPLDTEQFELISVPARITISRDSMYPLPCDDHFLFLSCTYCT